MPDPPGGPKSQDFRHSKQKSVDMSRQVKFASVEDDTEAQDDEKAKANRYGSTSSNGEPSGKNTDNLSSGSRTMNGFDKTASATDYKPAKDTQPSSFPSVGPPPNNINNYGGGQWYTSADPSQSLGATANQLPGGMWPNSLCGASPNAHFQMPWGSAPPQHLVNNIAYPAAFAPSPFPYQPNTVPIGQQGYVLSQQPAMMPQPMPGQQQHVLVNGQSYPLAQGMPAPGMGGMPIGGVGPGMMNGGGPPITGNSGNPTPPDVSGLGKTQGEETMRQLQFAHANKLFEPQDFKPADDDPSRFYYVREVDGNWTQRNRFTIDHMGDCRWYVTDEGWFYAVRLPD